MSAGVSHEEIRRMVRELLRDAVARGGVPEPHAAPSPATPPATPASEVGGLAERVRAALAGGAGGSGIEIAIAGDADLNAFARQVALCALERDLLGAIASNRVRFRLAAGAPGTARGPAAGSVVASTPSETAPAVAPAADGGAFRWEQGLLGETKITEIARTHDKLVLGRRALLTPLAWDRARSLGLQVVRMRA
ncbi:MAG: hypothetical protein R3322_22350 [Kiloniellales bacterium]|nr:hypothetical protein [Kiloniellales bacterium]